MGIDEQRSYGYTLTVSKLSGPRSAPFIQMQAGDLYHLGERMPGAVHPQVAVLIDAGYFLHEAFARLGRRLATAEEIVAAANSTLRGDECLFRIYYYDCPPMLGKRANPVDGAIHDFSTTRSARERASLHDKLEIADHVALRKGRLAYSGWAISRAGLRDLLHTRRPVIASDLQPSITQKGVDIKIGLDVAWLATRRIVDRIVLITGDTDFVPAMKLARREGVQVIIASISGRFSTHLLAHSDEHRIVKI